MLCSRNKAKKKYLVSDSLILSMNIIMNGIPTIKSRALPVIKKYVVKNIKRKKTLSQNHLYLLKPEKMNINDTKPKKKTKSSPLLAVSNPLERLVVEKICR